MNRQCLFVLQTVGKLVCLFWLVIYLPKAQANGDSVYEFDIPAQSLIKSLNILSNQTETLVLYPYDLVKNRTGNAVKGHFTSRQALDEMLLDTGLVGGLSKKGVLMISLLESETDGNKGEKSMNTKKTILASMFAIIFGANHAAEAIAETEKGSHSYRLDEIIVTARKTEENLQDVPVSITAFTASDLEDKSVGFMDEIANFTPNMEFAKGLGGSSSVANIFIRGVGQGDFLASFDPGVGIYLDGVYMGRMVGGVLDLLDVAGIEVLRGPQGTLFGKNTNGGAINVRSARPNTESLGGRIQTSLGSDNRTDFKASINVPLIDDRLAGRVSVGYQKRDGYGESLATGESQGGNEDHSGKISLLFTPGEDLEFLLNVDALKQRFEPNNRSIVRFVTPLPGLTQLYNAVVAEPVYGMSFDDRWFTGDAYKNYDSFDGAKNEVDVWGIGLTATWQLGGVQVKSITSYRDMDTAYGTDLDHSPLPWIHTLRTVTHEQRSQEFQFSSSAFDNRMTWLAGIYYFAEKGLEVSDIDIGTGFYEAIGLDVSSVANYGFQNKSYAAFVHVTYALTEQLSVSLGARYTDEEKDLLVADSVKKNSGAVDYNVGGISDSWREFSPKVGVEYHLNEDQMLYASYAEGFRSGGFNGRSNAVVIGVPYDPEINTSYEVGLKSQWWDNRIQTNLAAFFSDIEDMHAVVTICNEFGVCSGAVQNAAKAEIKGFEAEILALPTENLELTLGVGFVDAEFVEVDEAADITLDSNFPLTPEWSVNLGAQYRIPMDNGAELTIRGDLSYKSEKYLDLGGIMLQDAYTLYNARLSYKPAEMPWSLSLYGTNLSDEEYLASGVALGLITGQDEGNYGRPREFGLTFDYRF